MNPRPKYALLFLISLFPALILPTTTSKARTLNDDFNAEIFEHVEFPCAAIGAIRLLKEVRNKNPYLTKSELQKQSTVVMGYSKQMVSKHLKESGITDHLRGMYRTNTKSERQIAYHLTLGTCLIAVLDLRPGDIDKILEDKTISRLSALGW